MLDALVYSFVSMLITVVSLYKWVVIISSLLTWVKPDPSNPIVQILDRLTEPVYAVIRKKVRTNLNGIDLAPLVVIVALLFVEGFLFQIIR